MNAAKQSQETYPLCMQDLMHPDQEASDQTHNFSSSWFVYNTRLSYSGMASSFGVLPDTLFLARVVASLLQPRHLVIKRKLIAWILTWAPIVEQGHCTLVAVKRYGIIFRGVARYIIFG
eukprot:g9775.t1